MKSASAIILLIAIVALADCRHVQSRGKRAEANDGPPSLHNSAPSDHLTAVSVGFSQWSIEGIRSSQNEWQHLTSPKGIRVLRLHTSEDTLVRIHFKIRQTRTFEKVRAFLRYSCFYALDDEAYEKRIDADEVMERFCTPVAGEDEGAYTCAASAETKQMDLWMPKAADGPWWLSRCPRVEVHLVLHEEHKREQPIISAGFYTTVVEDAKAPSSINAGNDDPFDDW